MCVMVCVTGMKSLSGTRRPLPAMAPRWSALKLRIKVLAAIAEPTSQLSFYIADPIRGRLSIWDIGTKTGKGIAKIKRNVVITKQSVISSKFSIINTQNQI